MSETLVGWGFAGSGIVFSPTISPMTMVKRVPAS